MGQGDAVPLSRRYARPSDEDLPALSRLAFRLSAEHCAGCRNYHVMWPYLRSIGANGAGPEMRWADQVSTLGRIASGRGHVRWLLAGSADAGLLALVAAAMRTLPGVDYDATVVDRCATPLGLCRAYADTAGIDLCTVADDLGSHAPREEYDLILMHHLMGFMGAEQRSSLLRNAADWLAPGGKLVMSLGFDRPGVALPPRPNVPLMEWRERCIREASQSGELDLPEPLGIFLERLRTMREGSYAPVERHNRQDYEIAIADAGLVLEEELPFPAADDEPLSRAWRARDRFMWVAARLPA